MVGRESEFQSLESYFEAGGTNIACVLGGEPGIGKTTLWEVAVDRAQERGDLVLKARGSQAETQHSYAALIDIFDGVDFDGLAEVPAPQLRALEVALLRRSADRADADPHATALGLLAALRSLGRRRPVMIAIDDVQWIDSPSANALAFAVRRIEEAPVRLIFGMRSGEHSPVVDAIDDGSRLDVDLDPVDEVAIRRILLDRLDLTFPRRVVRSIHESSLGNPYLAIELGRTLAERDPLRIGEEIPAPDRAWELPGARVEALPDCQRDVLLAVSLSCDLGVSQLAAMGRSEALEDALDSGLVEIKRGRVSATHPLLAAASRAAAGSRECRDMHRQLAAVATEDETRALHLGLATNVPDEELAALLCAASEAASARGAREPAVELAEHALRLTPAESPRRPGHLNALAEALFVAGEGCRMNELLTPEIDGLPMGGVRGYALLLMCRALLMRGEHGDRKGGKAPVELLDRALEESLGDPKVRAIALARKAEYSTNVCVEDIPAARSMAADAVETAACADEEARQISTYALAWVRALAGEPGDEEADRTPANPRDEYHLVDSLERIEALKLMWSGDMPAARKAFEEMLRCADDRGEGASYFTLRLHLCDLELRAGNWDAAALLLEETEQSVGTAEPQQSARVRYRALLAAGRGDAGEAKRLASVAIEEAIRDGSGWVRLDGLRARGMAQLLDNDPAQAAGCLASVWRHAGQQGVGDPGIFPVANDLVEALSEIGEFEQASEVVDGLEAVADTNGHPWAALSVARGRAILDLRESPDDEAAETLCEVAEEYGHRGMRFDRARTLLALGRTLRRHKQWGGARNALDEAEREFDEIGSAGWAERTRAEIERIAARPPRATGELTPSERSTAELAAQGLANKEIAQRQFVTVNTVEAHLTRTYAKLGIRSRAQLTEKLAEVF